MKLRKRTFTAAIAMTGVIVLVGCAGTQGALKKAVFEKDPYEGLPLAAQFQLIAEKVIVAQDNYKYSIENLSLAITRKSNIGNIEVKKGNYGNENRNGLANAKAIHAQITSGKFIAKQNAAFKAYDKQFAGWEGLSSKEKAERWGKLDGNMKRRLVAAQEQSYRAEFQSTTAAIGLTKIGFAIKSNPEAFLKTVLVNTAMSAYYKDFLGTKTVTVETLASAVADVVSIMASLSDAAKVYSRVDDINDVTELRKEIELALNEEDKKKAEEEKALVADSQMGNSNKKETGGFLGGLFSK